MEINESELMLLANGDDIVFSEDTMLVRTGYGSMWVQAIMGMDSPLRFGGQLHPITAEQRSQLTHCVLIQRVNPLTGRFNTIRVVERTVGARATLTLG